MTTHAKAPPMRHGGTHGRGGIYAVSLLLFSRTHSVQTQPTRAINCVRSLGCLPHHWDGPARSGRSRLMSFTSLLRLLVILAAFVWLWFRRADDLFPSYVVPVDFIATHNVTSPRCAASTRP